MKETLEKIAKDYKMLTKLAKFRQIWSHCSRVRSLEDVCLFTGWLTGPHQTNFEVNFDRKSFHEEVEGGCNFRLKRSRREKNPLYLFWGKLLSIQLAARKSSSKRKFDEEIIPDF